VADDDRAVLDKLAALEAEVKADADAQRARKDAALAKLRAQRAADQAEKAELRKGQQAIVVAKSPRRSANVDDLGSALELAGKANQVKAELTKKPAKGEKSWIKSGIASMALGPIGWLYAGSLREAVPGAVGWVLLMTIAAKILPMVLLMPVLMVALPLSGIAGVVYALQYNRKGSRQRLFGPDSDKKQLPPGE
jgi:hypothetical protein